MGARTAHIPPVDELLLVLPALPEEEEEEEEEEETDDDDDDAAEDADVLAPPDVQPSKHRPSASRTLILDDVTRDSRRSFPRIYCFTAVTNAAHISWFSPQ